MRLALIVTAIALLGVAAHPQQRIESTRHGFSISVPDDWNEAPNGFLTQVSRAVSKRGQQLRYVGAYQQASFDQGLIYPYVLIQAIPYRDLGFDGPPTAAERSQILAEMTGLDLDEAIDAVVSEKASTLIEGKPSIDLVTYDDDTGGYVYDLRMNIVNVGAVRGQMRGAYGEWAILQAAYYAEDKNWELYEEQAKTILNSFDTVGGTPKPDYATGTLVPRMLGGAFRGAMGGAIIGGLFALVGVLGFYIYRKRSTPKPPPL